MFLFPVTIKKVQNWASKGKYDLLIEILGDPKCKTDVKIETINLLGKKQVAKAIPVLIGLINEVPLRKSLIACYGNLRDIRIYDTLINLLHHNKENEPEILNALENIHYPGTIPILLKMVTSGSGNDAIFHSIEVIADTNESYDVILKSFNPDQPTSFLISLCKILAGNEKKEIQDKLNEYIFTENALLRKEIGLAKKTKKEYEWADWLKGDADDFWRLAASDKDYVYDMLMDQYEKGNKVLGQYQDVFANHILFLADAAFRERALCFIEKHKLVKAAAELVNHIRNYDGQIRLRIAKTLSALEIRDYSDVIKGDTQDFMRLFDHNPLEGGNLLKEMVTRTFPLTKEQLQILAEIISDLGKSNKPEAVDVLVAGVNETSSIGEKCFDAIQQAGNEKFATILSDMLISYKDKTRIKAAKKLDQLGDHRWVDIVKGDDNDIERLCLAGCKTAIDKEIICLGLDRYSREKAANILLKVLKNNPQDVLNWSDIGKSITTPHKDVHEDNHSDHERTSDCHSDNEGHSTHDDLGFSLTFNNEQLQFFNEVDYAERRKKNTISEKYLIEMFESKQDSLRDDMFEDARQFSSKKLIEVIGRLVEKEGKYSKKAFEYLLLHKVAALPYFIKSLLSYRDEDIIREILAAGEPSYKLLINLLSESKKVEYVIEVLGLLGNKQAIDHIFPYLTLCENKGIRKSAAGAMINLGETDWKDIIFGDDNDFERLVLKCDVRLLSWYKTSFADIQYSYLKVLLAKTLARLGEKELAGGVRELLISSNHSVTDVAGALAMIDSTDWSKVILGNESDFERIAGVGNMDAVKVLLVFLKAAERKTRAAAAESLISIAKVNFSVVQDEWKSITATIAQKHEDSSKHVSHWAETRSGDCHSDFISHTDTGLGLAIPNDLDLRADDK